MWRVSRHLESNFERRNDNKSKVHKRFCCFEDLYCTIKQIQWQSRLLQLTGYNAKLKLSASSCLRRQIGLRPRQNNILFGPPSRSLTCIYHQLYSAVIDLLNRLVLVIIVPGYRA